MTRRGTKDPLSEKCKKCGWRSVSMCQHPSYRQTVRDPWSGKRAFHHPPCRDVVMDCSLANDDRPVDHEYAPAVKRDYPNRPLWFLLYEIEKRAGVKP